MSVSGYVAYSVFAIGVALASFSPTPLLKCIGYGSIIVLVVGSACVLRTSFIQPFPLLNDQLKPLFVSISKYRQLSILLLGQGALLFISLNLFCFLEKQTQINGRLHLLENGYILHTLQQYPFTLGVFPWLFFSILGVGLAYFSICLEKQPILSRAIITVQKNKLRFFFQNLLTIVTDVVTIGPYVFIVSFTLVSFCEVVNSVFGLDSLFLAPIRTIFICTLIILFFQKSNKQLIVWMNSYQVSTGKIFIIYILAFAFFISWLHGSSGWFTLGQEVIAPDKVAKSFLAGFYTEQALHTRMFLLIWGWWCIWIPWMASLVARASIGFTMRRAFFHSILVPFFLFGWMLPNLSSFSIEFLAALLKRPSLQAINLLILLLFVWTAWGKQRTVGEVSKGAMAYVGRFSKRSLNRWMIIVTLWLACYIPGWFMLGWLPLQVMVTLGGFFIMMVAGIFIGSWGASLFHLSASKKCTPQGSL